MSVIFRIEGWCQAKRTFLLCGTSILFILLMGAGGCQQELIGPGEVGSHTCLSCHDGRSATDHREWSVSPHQLVRCETCHGPGLVHVRDGGSFGLFINNPGKLPLAQQHLACIECHNDPGVGGVGQVEGFLTTAHSMDGALSCLDCHDVHKQGAMVLSSPTAAEFSNENHGQLCGQCHENQVAEFGLSGHAQSDVASCSSCHNMHASNMFRANPDDNRLCLQCHESNSLGFETDGDVDLHTGAFHPVDPAGSGSSRCVRCHLPPLTQGNHGDVAHNHTLFTTAPVESNVPAGQAVPPNSCSGIMGCHDSNVPGSGTAHDVNDQPNNLILQTLYDSIGVAPKEAS